MSDQEERGTRFALQLYNFIKSHPYMDGIDVGCHYGIGDSVNVQLSYMNESVNYRMKALIYIKQDDGKWNPQLSIDGIHSADYQYAKALEKISRMASVIMNSGMLGLIEKDKMYE